MVQEDTCSTSEAIDCKRNESVTRVYEVLALTLKMIWRLHKGLGIPAESLIKGRQQHAA